MNSNAIMITDNNSRLLSWDYWTLVTTVTNINTYIRSSIKTVETIAFSGVL